MNESVIIQKLIQVGQMNALWFLNGFANKYSSVLESNDLKY